jgi:hypothetical protein
MDREIRVSWSLESGRLRAAHRSCGNGQEIIGPVLPCGGRAFLSLWREVKRLVIRVNDKYRIHGTESCWQVEEFGGTNKDGTPRWKTLTWYVGLENAVASLADQRIRSIPDSALVDEVMKTLREIRQDVLGALTPFKKAV